MANICGNRLHVVGAPDVLLQFLARARRVQWLPGGINTDRGAEAGANRLRSTLAFSGLCPETYGNYEELPGHANTLLASILRAIAGGSVDWYAWRAAAWGTKADGDDNAAFRVHRTRAGLPLWVSFGFDTSWSAPEPWYRLIAREFPELCLSLTWIESGNGDLGAGSARDGDLVLEDCGSDYGELAREGGYKALPAGADDGPEDSGPDELSCASVALERRIACDAKEAAGAVDWKAPKLHALAWADRLDVTYLLRAGLDARSRGGTTAAMLAAAAGANRAFSLLVDAGADLGARTPKGLSALDFLLGSASMTRGLRANLVEIARRAPHLFLEPLVGGHDPLLALGAFNSTEVFQEITRTLPASGSRLAELAGLGHPAAVDVLLERCGREDLLKGLELACKYACVEGLGSLAQVAHLSEAEATAARARLHEGAKERGAAQSSEVVAACELVLRCAGANSRARAAALRVSSTQSPMPGAGAGL
jgi:hypothetical protein